MIGIFEKIGILQKMVILQKSFLVIDFDPDFHNSKTNFKGFLMVHILLTISKFLVQHKTFLDYLI